MRSHCVVASCLLALVAACGDPDTSPATSTDAGADGSLPDAGPPSDGATVDSGTRDATAQVDAALPCSTRVSYGAGWIAPSNHPDRFDVSASNVTWDGVCVDDGPNSYAVLSNGWKPYFQGHSACVLAFDRTPACGGPASCTTRITYGSGWMAPPNHPNSYDDVAGRVYGDYVCHGGSFEDLSNGWQPHFSGGSCPMSFRHEQCGGLYDNAVIPSGCPDPGVMFDGKQYVAACTGGGGLSDAYPIWTSPDLAHWTRAGSIFPAGKQPKWASGLFWAPEIHKVGKQFVAYFSAQNQGGRLVIGAASAPSSTGPFTDLGAPLIADPNMSLIDASEITTSANENYVLWKEDGNAQGKPTPIHSQKLSADGLSLVGSAATLITNDQGWEGKVVEGPFMLEHGGEFFLFYSGNAFYNGTYAVGVAKAKSPMGPFAKAGGPILVTNSAWVGPGHCSVLDLQDGETAMVYHGWEPGCVNGNGCGRKALLDRVQWSGGWPSVPLGPSRSTRPAL